MRQLWSTPKHSGLFKEQMLKPNKCRTNSRRDMEGIDKGHGQHEQDDETVHYHFSALKINKK